MPLDRSKYKRIPDLYVVGTEVVLKDGTPLWLQVLNPFEHDEARHDAALARSRIVLALKEFGSDELTKVRGQFTANGHKAAVDHLVNSKSTNIMIKIIETLQTDPDWKERVEIMERSEELIGRPAEDSERQLLDKANTDYTDEVQKQYTQEMDFLTAQYTKMSEEDLWAEFQEQYLDQRGMEVALREFKLTELWYAVRACEGVQTGDHWDHGACEGHRVRVFESKAEIRDLPTELQDLLLEGMGKLHMTERQAKGSGSQPNSSASSPQPNAEAELTASTPNATPDQHPGTSSLPSVTPSPSLAGSS